VREVGGERGVGRWDISCWERERGLSWYVHCGEEGRGKLTSIRPLHLSGKSNSAMRETLFAICARIVLSCVLERTIKPGTSSARRVALSASGRGFMSYPIPMITNIGNISTTPRER
jgi:hypothetical protein